MEFVKPSDEPHMNVLLYGPPKSGKSAGAATAPGANLFLNADLPNATRFAHTRDKSGRLLEVKLPPFLPNTTALFDLMAEIAIEVMKPNSDADSVVLDPVGEMYRRLLEEQSGRAIRPNRDYYGDVGTHIERFCRRLCEAPVNAVFVCHELQVTNGDEVNYIPFTGTRQGSPVLGQKLMGMVDLIGYTQAYTTENGETRFGVQLISGKGRLGGDRFGGCLGPFRDEINIGQWLEEVKEFEANGGVVVQPPAESAAETPHEDAPQAEAEAAPPARRGRKASSAASE